MYANQVNTGKTLNGREIVAIELRNETGMFVKLYNYGAIISHMVIEVAHDDIRDIVLGFDAIEGYLSAPYLSNYPYLGAAIGRYANRIKNATCTVNGKAYKLPENNNRDCLHGGFSGFDKKVWEVTARGINYVTMRYESADGEEGFPGNLATEIKFTLTNENTLILDISANTDQDTPLNLTHHSYFNLSPTGGSIATHLHQINASNILEQDDDYIATGKLLPVKETKYDFTTPTRIGDQWKAGEGYDQSFVLDKNAGALTLASRTVSPDGHLTLEVFTTEPIAHFYTSKYTQVENAKGGKAYRPFEAFCIETQGFSNGINYGAPGAVLKAGDTYRQQTVYKLLCKHNN